MGFQLDDQMIRLLCGRFSYEDGEVLFHSHKVRIAREKESDTPRYEASIEEDDRILQVTVAFPDGEEMKAACTCPAFHPEDQYCEHIAAALMAILDGQLADEAPERDQYGRLNGAEDAGERILKLFDEKPLRSTEARPLFDPREVLDVEFICKPVPCRDEKYRFGVELRIGPRRLYKVQHVEELLRRIEHREACKVSRYFTYDPELHSFRQQNNAILQLLIRMLDSDLRYTEATDDSERLLVIHSSAWEELLPLLAAAPAVKVMQGGSSFDGIVVADGPLPLLFGFDQSPMREQGYELDIAGLERVIPMTAYGCALSEGKLWNLPQEQLKRLADLQRIVDATHSSRIAIKPEQAEPFMEKVIPGLIKLGQVRISQSVSDQMVRTPLVAKLYLDRVKDRLLAGLEFHYGTMVINPLEGRGQMSGEGRILLRDGEKERRILELLERNSFVKTEGGFFLADEEQEFDFLHHVMPELEKLVHVFATTAVKLRLYPGSVRPAVKVEVDERTDWLEFRFEMDGIPESEIRRIIQSLEEKRKYHRLPNGALLPLDRAELQEIIAFLNDAGIRQEHIQGTRLRLPVARGLQWMDTVQRGNAIRFGKGFRKLLEHMRNPDHLEFPIPASIAPILREYQQYGFQWLKTLAHYRFGGILADEMGLGKTIQSIAFVLSVLPDIREARMPALIVCPASLMYNWRNELNRFAPELRVAIADGSKEERSRIVRDASRTDVIITSYPLLRQDIGQIAGTRFHTLILDEAQAFKNYATLTAQAVKAIQARHRFALTGTPVENRLEELWSICEVIFPGLFPGRREFNELSRDAVARRVRPFLLRRMKSDVLKELPEKIESLQASQLLPEQKKLYVAYLAELRQETVKHLRTGGFRKNRIKILAGLTRLRQLCCHPALFVEGYAGSSAKFEQLLDMIAEFRSAGRRILVFSQFTEMLGLIARELGKHGVPYFYLDGQTPARERVELCGRFNQGERDLFLLSLKAGGTGLNLTGADTIILYDLWWNPAVEQQAADRAHRIGQKNVVQVIRLVTQGTIEEKMHELQQKKMNLIQEVLEPNQEGFSAITEEEIRELLMI
ncbi:DEAD/DEAH box helicase [Paenibacillus dendritiformis]|uniref:DEAD/DEAH box helicase n=1 Tax=Paenibacillus dendritiformis TaxID=130049 RepID=UPI000DA84E3C|nr:DEAD/DEAH box helicase [Paenibacillus dendritiformis]PZM64682.1 helicase SNF [Paenibacillus dendritiformis]